MMLASASGALTALSMLAHDPVFGGCNYRQLQILALLAERTAPTSIREIGERLALEPPAIRRASAKLRRLGMIARTHPDDSDLRRVCFSLTPDGHAQAARLRRVLAADPALAA
jgi:DNA-binding MarR family transcriptional regulator